MGRIVSLGELAEQGGGGGGERQAPRYSGHLTQI